MRLEYGQKSGAMLVYFKSSMALTRKAACHLFWGFMGVRYPNFIDFDTKNSTIAMKNTKNF